MNLPAQLGLFAMLAGLVVASFVVEPAAQARNAAAPVVAAVDVERDAPRALAFARGVGRSLADFEPAAASALELGPIIEVAAEEIVTVGPEPTPEPTPERTPEPTPPPTPKPTPRPATPRPATPRPAAATNETTSWAETYMLGLINASRMKAGLVALVPDAGVAAVARAHSAMEAQVRYVYHDGPDGTAKSRNAPACGTGWWGENTGKIWRDNVDALHIEFMNEPWVPINHRTVIMDPTFRRVGIGAVYGPDAMYMTMVFCR